MGTVPVPANVDETLALIEALTGSLADADATQMSAEALARYIRLMERIGAIEAVARARYLAAFDAKDGHLEDG